MINQISPMNWNDDPDITDVGALNDSDEACIAEIKTVLEKHGRTSRFGITLLHSHFRLAEDEVFLEHTDVRARTLITRPVRYSEIVREHYRPTVWRFDTGQTQECSYCPTDAKGNHMGYKETC